MSHARGQIRAFFEDGPHAGETLPLDPDADGGAPRRVTLESPARRPGLGDATELSPDNRGATSAAVTYQLDGADLNLGIWRYRVVRPGQTP
jgi:hypothetical protein